jgi:hypothetical protein
MDIKLSTCKVCPRRLVPIIALIILGLFATKTLFTSDYFDGHDAQAHLVRLWQYDKAVKDGQFPPKWAGDLLAGRGYPVFIFTYQLPYAIAESVHLIGFSLPVAIKLTLILSYLISSLSMYIFANLYFKSRLSGFISSLLWSWAPFVFVKIFITASLGVVVSYMFIPLTFLFLYQILQKPNYKYSLSLALSLAGWILSHLGTLIIFSPLLFFFFLFHFNQKSLKHLLLSGLIAFGLSSWYLVPLLILNKFTHFQDFVLNQYESQFVPLQRLLYSKWGTGIPNQSTQPLSQQVGIAQWLAVLISLIILPARSVLAGRKAWSFLISFGLSIFLMLSISKPVWDLPTPLQSVSTPWRFLSLSVFSAAFLAGFVIKNLKNQKIKLAVFIFLTSLTIYGNRNHLRINQVVNYDQSLFGNYTGVATGWNEHMPIWVKETPKTFPESKVEIISGNCEIADLKSKSNLTSFTTNCHENSVIQINTAYFPGWKVFVNDQIITDEIKQNLESSNGQLRFNLNSGSHQVYSRFN